MKHKNGYIIKMDGIGRVVIPKGIRDSLNLGLHDCLAVSTSTPGRIVLRVTARDDDHSGDDGSRTLLDGMGRVVIPMPIRRDLNVRDQEPFDMRLVDDSTIIMSLYRLKLADTRDVLRYAAFFFLRQTGATAIHITGLSSTLAMAYGAGAVPDIWEENCFKEYITENGTTSIVTVDCQNHRCGVCARKKENGRCPYGARVIAPVVVDAAVVGAIVYSVSRLGKELVSHARLAADFVAGHIHSEAPSAKGFALKVSADLSREIGT